MTYAKIQAASQAAVGVTRAPIDPITLHLCLRQGLRLVRAQKQGFNLGGRQRFAK